MKGEVNSQGSTGIGTPADWPEIHEAREAETVLAGWITAVVIAAGLILLVRQERNQSKK